MDRFEEAVLEYITAVPERFVNPQFSIPYGQGKGGSVPDFVVLDFRGKSLFVVEVTSASNTTGVLERVQERQKRWISPLKAHFQGLDPCFGTWEYRVTLFVRGEEEKKVRSAMAQDVDISVFSLDQLVFPWRWNWIGQRPDNPLR